MPWLRRPWLVSSTAMLLKSSIFEPDLIKKRICYDLTASGFNPVIDDPQSSLPTIFRLLEAMGPNHFMAKSVLKDMFFNFYHRFIHVGRFWDSCILFLLSTRSCRFSRLSQPTLQAIDSDTRKPHAPSSTPRHNAE